ncbi:MAG: hypothetical protein QGI80_03290, partial [archaeon]|nr:hypothetical protein [archaeon]
MPRNLNFQGNFCHALTIDQCVIKITLKKQGVGQHKNPAKQQNVKTETARNPTMLRRFCRKPHKNKKRIFRKKMLKQPTGYKKAGKKTTETHRQANGTSKDKKQQHKAGLEKQENRNSLAEKENKDINGEKENRNNNKKEEM